MVDQPIHRSANLSLGATTHVLLVFSGCQQFSTYSGYGDTFRWKGPYADPTGRYEPALAVNALESSICSLRVTHRCRARRLTRSHPVRRPLQGRVGSEAAAGFGHGCPEVHPREGSVQHETGGAGTQQGEGGTPAPAGPRWGRGLETCTRA